MKTEIQKLIDEWQKIGKKYQKQACLNDHNEMLQERYFVMAETYDYCADRLRRILKKYENT